MEHCELVPGRGIRHGKTEIFFNEKRTTLRAALGEPIPPSNPMWDDEDEFVRHGEEWLRLRFVDNKLADIEVLGGTLSYKDIELKHTDVRTLKDGLNNHGLVLTDVTEWLSEGRDCIDLQIVVATAGDVEVVDDLEEGKQDRIAWVITSRDFEIEDA